MTLSRRNFFLSSMAALGTTAGMTLASPALALSSPTVGIECLHTGRSCAIEFDGTLSSRHVEEFKSVTRDWRQNETYGMDLKLIPILAGIITGAGSDQTFGLLSGYRSPETNRKLSGTASRSLHMFGQAMDIRRADLSTRELYTLARRLGYGGVGFYPQSRNRFVHIDTGQVRYW